MKVRWSLYRFDYGRYVQMRPVLRGADHPQQFETLSLGKETEFLLEELQMQRIDLPDARAGFVFTLCCKGEPLNVDRNFARCVATLPAYEEGEEGRELLSALLTGGRNLEPWMLPTRFLNGFLTPEETVTLYAACVPEKDKRRRSGPRFKRSRKPVGGLVGAYMRLFRQLLDRGLLMDEMLELLGDLLEEAVKRGEGVAVVAL